ncbi:UDP-forming cellulose synthase catalytic subunit [uncultured Photobacterium sp.]|uniref:UDP-forming cellulose synthase catalytic subunit n=1 Tax=uncultured Photobacterium sp. TaxID=173973 RepID=UPI00262BAC68|nr:UDP-forming cellulose synthase catalytic subunit [uncultured Photobacterium sp.]
MFKKLYEISTGLVFKPLEIRRLRKRYAVYVNAANPSILGRLTLCFWFVICLVFLQPRVGTQRTWALPIYYFPHVQFKKPGLVDLFSFVFQLFWLFLVKQDSKSNINFLSFHKYNFLSGCISKLAAFMMPMITWFIKYFERENDKTNIENKNKSKLFEVISLLVLASVMLLSILFLTIPFNWKSQAIFVFLLWLVAMLVKNVSGRLPVFLLIILSLTASCRYIWWRYTSTLNWDDSLDLVMGLILLLAETYSWLVLVLGYFQNIWPLKRKPVVLPEATIAWPTIDLMIPTYNEDLDVVKTTVLSALGADWPKDKLNIYILDDGHRDDFRIYAKQVGVNYLSRPTNEYAKAGNLNYALKHSSGEFVAIFDCDHVPTRAFFQMTMGAFLHDQKLALVQTPHHFFSPDPFERNLANFRKVPNEGHLFYGLVQDGNDLWDATFFCGSCAILRRSALEEVGGIAVETVTEDAHTFLKIHRRGYKSAYLRRPISAGLATETLSAHIGQRIRWARGMAQIFRIDNPLTGKGLKWHQRLCYLNAMMHFLSGIPRLVFLVAPLAFLIFHANIIYAPALAIVLYVIPHMLHANLANSKIQGQYRHSFWGEIYETVLAWYIAIPTTVALCAPKKGKFNVTEKGGLIEQSHFDWNISKPYLLLILLNVAGVCFGLHRIGWGPDDEVATTIINLLWTFYNLLLLGGAIAVADEVKQVRKHHRIDVEMPAIIKLETGHLYPATVKDYSLGGLRVKMKDNRILSGVEKIDIVLKHSSDEFAFQCHVVHCAKYVGLKLDLPTTQQQIDYVQCTFAKADNWYRCQQRYQTDRPLVSLKNVILVSFNGYKTLFNNCPKVIRLPFTYALAAWDFILLTRPKVVMSREV